MVVLTRLTVIVVPLAVALVFSPPRNLIPRTTLRSIHKPSQALRDRFQRMVQDQNLKTAGAAKVKLKDRLERNVANLLQTQRVSLIVVPVRIPLPRPIHRECVMAGNILKSPWMSI